MTLQAASALLVCLTHNINMFYANFFAETVCDSKINAGSDIFTYCSDL
jgi:hypothetical protein